MNEPGKTTSPIRALAFVLVYGTILGVGALGGVYLGTRVVYGAWLTATKAHPAKVYDCPWWVVAGSFGLGIVVLLVFLWGLRRTGLAEKLVKLLIR
jgi:hypothetical protein